jgi:hypothetical protein
MMVTSTFLILVVVQVFLLLLKLLTPTFHFGLLIRRRSVVTATQGIA